MSIEFPCPGCRNTLRVADSAAGKKARCPECGAISDVPQAGQGSGSTAGASSFGAGPGSASAAEDSTWSTGNWSPSAAPNRPDNSGSGGSPSADNPFAQSPTAPPGSSDNPFASPQPSFSSTRPLELEELREKVKAPAICLIVVSAISIVGLLALLALQILIGVGAAIGQGANNGGGGPDNLILMGFGVIPSILRLARAGVMIYGAIQMKNLENYPLAMASAILATIAIIPCFSLCCLMDLPFGIWALVVLSDPQVKRGFDLAGR